MLASLPSSIILGVRGANIFSKVHVIIFKNSFAVELLPSILNGFYINRKIYYAMVFSPIEPYFLELVFKFVSYYHT